jgi:hypothetical protein
MEDDMTTTLNVPAKPKREEPRWVRRLRRVLDYINTAGACEWSETARKINDLTWRR